ncbi:cupin domain-containing protein [Hyphomicrobium sp. xq]|uniref:Cupin domain-containing protein n=1 Tax=Hyphomicrobium album TaxID=2665159 RepID=A0A6I3KIN1_9HYPH|nr:cupin domain-containing protein [Hyphomicrobium album]MTD95585.1 cupin domain-containing protein [Hyphomicrobium album]
MKRKQLSFKRGFHVAIDEKHAQAAEMTIAPGGEEGGPDNRHRGADQWLFVVSGSGEARIEGRKLGLVPGMLVLIERGEKHEICNTGAEALKTLNFYVPPAYTKAGNERSPGKS